MRSTSAVQTVKRGETDNRPMPRWKEYWLKLRGHWKEPDTVSYPYVECGVEGCFCNAYTTAAYQYCPEHRPFGEW